ncbi:TetR/AcrR family transcriptional regulator [Cellulomonas endophytica]|uniref:TetR/AcrR family transcriptional regulator n=1 Tax=Cellulomonas endophytica TaxID=2494735 RepID=UPI001011FFCD|nr:TetR/AcrR family transcriptional regulator [Cellulomonas endophytica]
MGVAEETASGARRRGDTRDRIRDRALARFTEQGYDQTSLREIAEDLGVTKAAVYYHFRSKEEIVESLVAEVGTTIEDLISWVRTAPRTRETRLELLRRLGEATAGGMSDVVRCVQQNEVALQGLPGTENLVHRIKHRLWEAALPEGAGVEERLRVRLALMAVLTARHTGSDLGGTPEERAEVAQRVAADLMP